MNFLIARVAKHLWEEPPISGNCGSGTIFFSGCQLRCAYCQNFEISHGAKGLSVDCETLVKLMLYLEKEGAHNINLVTPSHFAKALPEVLEKAKRKLKIPIVYNCGGYETLEDLKRLDGLVDIYLPDFKYASDTLAERYSRVKNYKETAILALKEMRRQQKSDVMAGGLMKKGVIVRHLVLPSHVENSLAVLDEIAKIDRTLYVGLMAQYFPTASVMDTFPELNRRITKREYKEVLDYFFKVGLTNGFTQSLKSAVKDYVPSFDLTELEKLIRSL